MGHDLWFALRRIRRRPLHSAMVALTLALGLGASLAVFTAVDAVLLHPLPYPEPGRLVRVTGIVPAPGFPELSYSDIGFHRLTTDARSFAATAAWETRDANLVEELSARRLILGRVSAGFFDVLGVRPALGRGFRADEDLPNGPRVLVLSDWLWRSAFHADPAVIGRSANLEGVPYTIIGVLSPAVTFPSREVAALEPLGLDPAAANPYNRRFGVIARLRPGVSLELAQREATASAQAVGRDYPGPHPGSALDASKFMANVRPLADVLAGDARPVVLLLLAGVLMLLLLTCANVANLQLAAVVMRTEELAVRAALGATKRRLVRGSLIEGVLLAAVGGGLGLLLAGFGARLLASLMPPGIAVAGQLSAGRLLAVTVIAVLAIGAAVGALPVALIARRESGLGIRERSSGTGPARANQVRRFLAGAQVALAVLLAHNAGLLIASARAMQDIPLGFRADSTITIRLNLPDATFRDRTARESLLRRLIAEVAHLPGVTAAGIVNALPLTPGRQDLAMAVEGRPFKADGTDPLADYRVVSHDYFAAMGIPLQRGALFTDDDANERYTPLVISAGLAHRLFPDGTDPIGHRLRFGPAAPWMPIVGVVGDARNRSLTEDARPELYAPGLGTYAMLGFASEITLVVRAHGDAMVLAAPIRRVIADAAPDVATYNLASLADIVHAAGVRMTTATRLMGGYAAAALLLAMAGTYAVLSYLVAQRRRELAVRMALGAAPRSVVALVARESARLLVVGVIIGLAGATATSRLLGTLLYGVRPLDPGVLLAVVTGAAIAGVAAAVVPAVQAVRVDPSISLRAGD